MGLEYHVELVMNGMESELDEHQKWVEETAALAGRHVVVKKAVSNEGFAIARFSSHFEADRPMDAQLMGIGLMGPRSASIEVITMVVARMDFPPLSPFV